MSMRLALRTGALVGALSLALHAGPPVAWESNSWPDFVKGRFNGVALTRDGRLTLAPRFDALAATGEASVWSVTRASDGALWFATGHRGRVFRVEAGKAKLVWTAHEPEVFALAAVNDGAVFAASSPGGRIWRIDASGKAEEWFATKAKYVWALSVDKSGVLYAATGDEGRVYRITARAQGELYYETGQAHVTALAWDRTGALLAGTEPNGNLYRIAAKDRATVLYHSSLPEIRDIAVLDDGSILVASLGGALAQKQAAASAAAAAAAAAQPAAAMQITITADSSAAKQPDVTQAGGVDAKPAPARAAAPAADAAAAAMPAAVPTEVAGVERSNLVRIAPDLTTEVLWTSKEENLFALAVVDGVPYVGSDQRGRVYSVLPNLKSALVVETGEGEVTRLIAHAGALTIATGTQAKLYALTNAAELKGSYESPVHDAGSLARWGRVEWRGDLMGASVEVRTRSGNSQRPDKTWSEWSAPLTDPATAKVASPNARYIQWRAELRGTSSFAIDALSISYQPQNNRPAVHAITVTPQWVALPQRASATGTAAQPPTFAVTVSDAPDPNAPATSAGTSVQQVNRVAQMQLYVSWQADDPDNDRLLYTLQVKGESEREWKTLKADLGDNTFALDADSLADGRYRFRVVASDRASNPPSSAREAELDSAPVVVDQTPPRVSFPEPKAVANGFELVVDAEDALSPVRRAEYSVDGGVWRAMECADGVADSLRERFTAVASKLGAGEHIVSVRVYDASGNAGLARRVIR